MKHFIFHFFFAAAVFLLAVGGSVWAQWSGPSDIPPNANVPAPINVSGTAQTKGGDLTIFDPNVGINALLTTEALDVLNILNVASTMVFDGTGITNQSDILRIDGPVSTSGTLEGADVSIWNNLSANGASIIGGRFESNHNSPSYSIGDIIGVRGRGYQQQGSATNVYGGRFEGFAAGLDSATNVYGVYGGANTDVASVTNAYGLYSHVGQTTSGIVNGYGVYIADVAGTNDYALYAAGANDESFFAGNVTVQGKLNASGGVDPPYISFSAESHESIREYAKAVDEHEKVMQFWNGKAHRLEIYVVEEDAFYTLGGELIKE